MMQPFTELNNRTLWFDGDSTVSDKSLVSLLLSGKTIEHICTDQMSPDIEQYNKLVPKHKKITVKTQLRSLDFDWNIPVEYKTMDVAQFVYDKFQSVSNCFGESEKQQRLNRLNQEFKLYKQYNLIDTLRTIIYVINNLSEKNIPWGVGRGSSVSSYVLYIIGVHDVDSVLYDLDINDFLHSKEIEHGKNS